MRQYIVYFIQRQFSSTKKSNMIKNKGFTLVEVVVTMAIIGIASAITLSAISGGRVRKEVEGDARRLAATLRSVQNDALSGRQIVLGRVSCSFSFPASSAGATAIAPVYAYRNGASCATTLDDALPVFNLTPGVTISVANIGVRFVVPWGKVRNGAGTIALASAVQYRLVKSGVTWTVCVYPEGRIEEKLGTGCPA
jgi:prepilin-type N-terminal cleavage/methylation domain-containing protein